jgi:peptidoglycan pentaglycine glycine transferase (the first glycine)
MSAVEAKIIAKVAPESSLFHQWEKLVAANQHSGVMQSLHWAEFKRCQRLQPLHIGLFDNDQLMGGAIFYESARHSGAGILVAPEGPVLPWQCPESAAEGLRLIMELAETYAGTRGIMAMRIEPRLEGPVPRLLREFGRAPVDLIPRETLYLDLTTPTEQLLQRMKPKGRYNIGLSARHGVQVTASSDPADVNRFYEIIKEASLRDRFLLEQRQFFEQLARALCPQGVARFLFAEHAGETLGTMLLLTYGSRATYLYGGISNKKRNLMGGYALQWAAIQAAQQAGCSTYDFYGFDQFGSPLHAYARFSQFKRQFGGEPKRLIGAQDHFFLDGLADAFIKAVSESNRTAVSIV